MTWQLKLDPETNAPIINDGKILYVDPDGNDLPLDPPAMYQKIGELGKLNKKDREKYQEMRDRFAPLAEIEDIADWKTKAEKAMEAVQNFNDKDWMAASKVEALKNDMRESYEAKLKVKDGVLTDVQKQYEEKLNKKDGQIRILMVSSKFSSSPYFTGPEPKTNLRPDIAESHFGKHFKVELDEKTQEAVLRAYYSNGDPIISKINPGEPADFDEAMGMIIDKYPGKDAILKASGGGSGGSGGKGTDDSTPNKLEDLKIRHKAAVENHRTTEAVALKNQIFELEQSLRK